MTGKSFSFFRLLLSCGFTFYCSSYVFLFSHRPCGQKKKDEWISRFCFCCWHKINKRKPSPWRWSRPLLVPLWTLFSMTTYSHACHASISVQRFVGLFAGAKWLRTVTWKGRDGAKSRFPLYFSLFMLPLHAVRYLFSSAFSRPEFVLLVTLSTTTKTRWLHPLSSLSTSMAIY